MASPMPSFAARSVVSQLQQAGRRSYATARPPLIANRARWTPRPISHQIALRQSIRQQSTEAPKPKPKKRFRFLRWTWRLTYISAIAGAAYIGYGIWDMRHPEDQPAPDPNKKTLVILGKYSLIAATRSIAHMLMMPRYRLGLCLAVEEA